MKQEYNIEEVCSKELLKSSMDAESLISADNSTPSEEIASIGATVKLEENNDEFVKRALRDADPKNRFCHICRRSYMTRDSLLRHHKHMHENVKPNISNPNNQCTACDKTFKSRYNFRKHLIRIHLVAVSEFICNDGLDIEDNINYCKSCDQIYTTRENYRIHLIKFHNIVLPELSSTESRVTAGCPTNVKLVKPSTTTVTTTLSQDSVLSKHNMQDKEKNNKYCYLCDKTYSSMDNYRRHLTRTHSDLIQPPPNLKHVSRIITPIIDDTKNYCTACTKWYTSKESFRKHLVKIHKIMFSKIPGTSKTVPVIDHDNNYCNLCKWEFIDKHTYRKHLLRIHKVVLPKVEKPIE